jgi:hypothetical protein
LGKFPGNPPHRGNLRGNSHSRTAKARDNSRPAPSSNSPIPQNLRRNLKRKIRSEFPLQLLSQPGDQNRTPTHTEIPYLFLMRSARAFRSHSKTPVACAKEIAPGVNVELVRTTPTWQL